jgi:glycosylphosphatidylinositol transamidase (GPIT) subunit GPI8
MIWREKEGSGWQCCAAPQIVQSRVFAKYMHKTLPTMLTFSHRLKQIGFCDDCIIVDPDLDLAANSSVLRKLSTWNREQ